MPRILFCNIAYMEYYDLIIYPNDTPKHGGSYVKDTGSAFESWNFHRYPDGYYGFVETKYTKKQTAVEQYARQLHIERIDPEAAGDSVDHVMVLFCAHSDALDETVLVGWYPDATVYRRRRKHEDGHTYNLHSQSALLLPPSARTMVIPRANKQGVGFGSDNLWYAEKEEAQELINEVYRFIGSSESVIQQAIESQADGMSAAELAAAANTYQATATLRRRNPYLPALAKKRANGICQLCRKSAPFVDEKGNPYLEAHHIVPLAENGPDCLENMVALCPNCHRKVHHVPAQENIEKMKNAANGFHVDISMVPKPNMDRFIRAMAEEMLRVKVEEPETWAKICARAEEIRREKAHKA